MSLVLVCDSALRLMALRFEITVMIGKTALASIENSARTSSGQCLHLASPDLARQHGQRRPR